MKAQTAAPWWTRASGSTTVALVALLSISLAGCTTEVAPSATPAPEASPLSMSAAGDMTYLCLRELGWEVEIDWDGGILSDSTKIPAAQLDQYLEDERACMERTWTALEVDTSEREQLYADELLTRDCLIAEGYDIPTPPSKQVYLDTYDNELWMAWSYVDVRELNEDQYRALNVSCPQPQWSAGS